MRQLVVTLAIVSAFSAAPAKADVTLGLNAIIRSSCQILSVTPVSPLTGMTVEVRTACNVESFSMLISSSDGAVQGATAVSRQATVSGGVDGRLAVRLNRPGVQEFVVTLAETPTDAINIEIVPG